MKKSIYSLMLIDELVDRLDRVAYARGQNRSALINEILAEYLSYTTPEMRMQQVFDSALRLLQSGDIQLLAPPAGGGMVLRSAIRYKYNPTVRYSIELFPAQTGAVGRLRAALRTRSEVLLRDAARFFVLWDELERRLYGRAEAEIEPGRYTRILQADGLSSEQLGEHIAAYVQLFDDCLRLYFENLSDPQAAAAEIGRRYAAHLRSGAPLL